MLNAKRFSFFLTKENWVKWQCVRLFISFYDLFRPFLKRFPWNKSWKCRGTKSYHLSNSVQEYQCTYDKSYKNHKGKVTISNIWKKVVEKVNVNVFFSCKSKSTSLFIISSSCNFETAVISCKKCLKNFYF